MADEWKRGTFVYDVIGLGHTPTNLMNALQSFLTQVGWERASWDTATVRYFLRTDRSTDNYWMFNGDGAPQACGIRIELDAAGSRILIRTFLQNQAGNALQIASSTTHQIVLAYDSTAPNNLLFIGGKKGFYFEDGRDGKPTNLAHGMIVAWEPVPEYNGTDDLRVNRTTQGAACDLFGSLKFCVNRSSYRFVDSRNGNRAYSGNLAPFVCRGSLNSITAIPVDNPNVFIGPRDHVFGIYINNNDPGASQTAQFTFGLAFTPRDGRFRVSPLMVDQSSETLPCVSINSSGLTNVSIRDIRAIRQATRFVVVDGTLIPFVNLTDAATSVIYRIAQVADLDRPANIGIAWPDASNIVTVTG